MIVVLSVVALLTAWLSAVAGLGGGTILIAAMYALGLSPVLAVPLHAAVQLVANGSRTFAYLRHVDWKALRWFLLGAVPTPFLMAPLVARADPDWIRLGMALFILLAVWPQWIRHVRMHGNAGMVVAGGIAGGVGSIVGASGLLIGPFFLRNGWRKETVIATLAAAQSAAHLLKIVAFASFGFAIFDDLQLLLPMAAAVVLGTLAGRLSAGKLADHHFRFLFRAILILLAIKLGWDACSGLIQNGAGPDPAV